MRNRWRVGRVQSMNMSREVLLRGLAEGIGRECSFPRVVEGPKLFFCEEMKDFPEEFRIVAWVSVCRVCVHTIVVLFGLGVILPFAVAEPSAPSNSPPLTTPSLGTPAVSLAPARGSILGLSPFAPLPPGGLGARIPSPMGGVGSVQRPVPPSAPQVAPTVPGAARPNGELAPIDDALLKALPDFKDIERAPSLVAEPEIRIADNNATAQARRELQARVRFRELKDIALRDPELVELDRKVRAASSDRSLRSALTSYNERLFGLIRKLDPSLAPLIEERKAAALKGVSGKVRE